MDAGWGVVPGRTSAGGDGGDPGAEDGREEKGALDDGGQGLAGGFPGEAVGEDPHGGGGFGGSTPGFADVGSEEVDSEGVVSEAVGSDDAVEGVDELTDGVGRSAFRSCRPVSPCLRWNQSPWSGS